MLLRHPGYFDLLRVPIPQGRDLDEDDVRAGGLGRRGAAAITQRLRLEAEGVSFDARGRASLAVHRWTFGRYESS